MKKRKTETFIYEALGFPVLLINVPMRETCGEWVLDINFAQLQRTALLMLVKKTTHLSGGEIRFIRHYLNMSTHEFSKLLGVTHVSVLNWESEKRKMNVSAEILLRLRILHHLKVPDKEFKKMYLSYDPKTISSQDVDNTPLEIDADEIAC